MHVLQFHFPFIVFAASDLWPRWLQCQHQHKLLEAPNSCLGGWNRHYPNLCHLVAITAFLKVLAEQDIRWLLGCCFSQPCLLNVNENDSLSSYKKHKDRCPSGNWEVGNPASPELVLDGLWEPLFDLAALHPGVGCSVVSTATHTCVSLKHGLSMWGPLLCVRAVHDTAGSIVSSSMGLGLFRCDFIIVIAIGLTWLFLVNSCNTSNWFVIPERKKSTVEVVKLKHCWSAVLWHSSWMGALAEEEGSFVKLPLSLPVSKNFY